MENTSKNNTIKECNDQNFPLAISTLEAGEYTCVLTNGIQCYTSKLRGVKPLLQFLRQGNLPHGLTTADKVVGKATAHLYILLQIQGLYAKVISKPAVTILQAYGIEVRYETLAENIINRQGNGICPFEEAVLNIDNPQQAHVAILNKLQELNITI